MPNNTHNLPDRTFGVEIEATGITRGQATRALRSAGLEAEMESYNHRTRDHWKVTTDASVEPGWEVVSPVLRGEEGLESLRTAVSALSAAGARVNRSCGIHVHVGVDDLTPNEIAGIVIRYGRFEDEIDAFMPQSRRGRNNTYCNSVSTFAASLARVGSFERVTDVQRHQPGRFLKVNLEAYGRQQTIEFRQHSGSCDTGKIENWVRFLLHFVEATQDSLNAVPSTPGEGSGSGNEIEHIDIVATVSARPRRNSVDAKLNRLIRALDRAGARGLPIGDIASLGDWSRASVPVYISRLRTERGASIRKNRWSGHYILDSGSARLSTDPRRAGETTRRAARGVSLSPTDSLYQGMPPGVAVFYAERTAEFAGEA